MTNLTGDSRIAHDEAVLLLPWYVTGRLSDFDTRRMQRHLAECERCRAEATAQQALKSAMGSASSIDYAPQASLSKLMERIDASEPGRMRLKSWLTQWRPIGSDSRRRSARKWVWTLTIATGVQAMAIVVLLAAVGWFALRPAPPAAYQTLTTVTGEPVHGAAVRIVFDDSLRNTEMQSLLHSIDARIVSGPTSAGAYTIQFDRETGKARSAAEMAQWLRAQPGVRFAEPVIRQE